MLTDGKGRIWDKGGETKGRKGNRKGGRGREEKKKEKRKRGEG